MLPEIYNNRFVSIIIIIRNQSKKSDHVKTS